MELDKCLIFVFFYLSNNLIQIFRLFHTFYHLNQINITFQSLSTLFYFFSFHFTGDNVSLYIFFKHSQSFFFH